MTKRKLRCVVCRASLRAGWGAALCGPCGKSYDRAKARADGSALAMIVWAAKRTRYVLGKGGPA